MRVLPGRLSDLPFGEPEVEGSEVATRLVICQIGGGYMNRSISFFHSAPLPSNLTFCLAFYRLPLLSGRNVSEKRYRRDTPDSPMKVCPALHLAHGVLAHEFVAVFAILEFLFDPFAHNHTALLWVHCDIAFVEQFVEIASHQQTVGEFMAFDQRVRLDVRRF
jgi:hypothetical protein